jgi:hypothetical protein
MRQPAAKHSAAKPAAREKPPQPLIQAQPQSAQIAAPQQGLFLSTNDLWSQNYFNDNDLHSLERLLFG